MGKKTKVLKNIMWVIRSIMEYDEKYLFIVGIVTMIGGILPPLCTIISQKIMNGLQERRDLHTLLFLVIVYVGIDLFQTLLGYLVIYHKYKFAQGYNLHFNQKVLQKAAGLNLKSYENSEIYDMISRAQYEIEGKLIVYFESFIGIFSSMITTVSYLLIIIRFRIWIVPCIILVPIVKFLINRAINSETFAVIRERTNDSRKCWYIQHVLTYGEAYKELKIYNLFQYFIDKHFEYNKRFNEENLKLKKKSTVQLGGTTIIETFIDGVIFVYIIFAGYLGEIMIGNVVTYMKTITQVKSQIMSVLQSFSDMNQESMFIDQLKEYLDLPEEDIEKEDEQIEITRIENIEIKHLYYRYKEDQQYVLKDVNFFIDGTKTIAIVGQNGSGKTTLLKIIMGFYTDYEGEVFINGIEMRKINKTSMRRRIATLFQDFYKYEATFRENIAYGNLDALQDDRKLIFTCRKFDLEKLINESNEKLECQIGYWFDNGKQISLGQWQKIGLARAFFKDADLYILDEPNAALDAITEYRLSVLYKELLKKKKGIIVAHKFNNLVKQVDDIIVLEHGEITGIGSHENLLKTNETYKTLYEMQVG